MNFPSTSTDGANPSLGDVLSNVGSSHGVRLTGGSTGGIVEPAGDDANITLIVRGKGTGGVQLGNSSSPVTIGSGTAGIKGAYSQTSTYSHAGIAASRIIELTFASTTVDINPGDLLSIGFYPGQSSVTALAAFRMSTVNSSRLTVSIGNISSTNGSTDSGSLFLSWLDLS